MVLPASGPFWMSWSLSGPSDLNSVINRAYAVGPFANPASKSFILVENFSVSSYSFYFFALLASLAILFEWPRWMLYTSWLVLRVQGYNLMATFCVRVTLNGMATFLNVSAIVVKNYRFAVLVDSSNMILKNMMLFAFGDILVMTCWGF